MTAPGVPGPAGEAPPPAGGGPESAFVRTFPCVSCGAKLSFAPGTHTLRCEYCGATNEFAEDDARVEELDLAAFLKELQEREETYEDEQVRCGACGAEQSLGAGLFASKCAFCGAALVSKSYANRRVKPRSLVPFQVGREKAQEAFRRWLRWQWLAPGDLKRYAQSDATLSGIYLPFWTFDCHTSTDYTGWRGTRRDKSTRWTAVSGHVEKSHDDVLVLASRSLPESIQGAVRRWDTSALVAFQPEFVSGFQAEAYQLDLPGALPVGRRMIDEAVRARIRRDIGGDEQKIESVRTRYSALTFKHVLLPVWISAYRYRDRTYRFLVNGQTGETDGESPLSWVKLALIAVAGLVLLYYWIFG